MFLYLSPNRLESPIVGIHISILKFDHFRLYKETRGGSYVHVITRINNLVSLSTKLVSMLVILVMSLAGLLKSMGRVYRFYHCIIDSVSVKGGGD